ncbi:MAG: sigma-70 family RNA polymerase sigma factor [Thermodesulfobacteriota bacterium]
MKDYTQAYRDQSTSGFDREEAILKYLPMIKYIAQRLIARLPPQVTIDDLISSGIIGLINALERFDTSKNVKFKTYAEFRIKGAMLDELRSLDWVPRSIRRKITELEKTYSALEKKLGRPAKDEEVAEEMGLSLDKFYKLLDETKSVSFIDLELLQQKKAGPDSFSDLSEDLINTSNDPFSNLALAQIRDLLAQAIEQLPENEKLTVSLYYREQLTMKEIGDVLGYTESRISQMHSKAMYRLRSRLKKALA